MSFNIIGTGSYLPEKVLTNAELEKMVETNDEWIKKRVGISERRIATHESTSFMGAEAAKKALLMSGLSASDLDLIICATISSEDVCPSAAAMIQKQIGANCPAFDISSACSGFIFALETARGFFEAGTVKNVLVVASERLSKLVDYTDRGTCIIFGDGAGAAVLTKGSGYCDSILKTVGDDAVIKIPSFAGASPFYEGEKGEPYMFMNGQETFKFAVESMCRDTEEVLKRNNLSSGDLKYVIPHQANTRIISFAAKRLKMDLAKFYMNIERFGNTGAASIPISLDELVRKGEIKKGDKLVLVAFGGGLSSGVCLVEW